MRLLLAGWAVAAVLRGERPEVTAALADVLATTASVLRDLAGESGRSDRASAPTADEVRREVERDGDGDGDGGRGTVQRIDIA